MTHSMRAKRKKTTPASLAAYGLLGAAGFSLAAAGSWILYSKLAIDHQLPLPEAIPAGRSAFLHPRTGLVSYYHQPSSTGRPLVLIHSINAAASAYEMRPLFLHYRAQRPVFALELPGFGFSERGRQNYTPGLYQQVILDFLRGEVQEPADVIALSLSSEFAAMAALAQPELFASLTLLSPTGFGVEAEKPRPAGSIYPALAFPLWGRPLFDLIATRASIEYFLAQSFIGPVPPEMVDYAYITAHQPNAEHAPLQFVSGKLFTRGVRQHVYERLQVPTLVVYDRDNFVSFDLLPTAAANNSTYLQVMRLVPSLGLPQFERLEYLTEQLDRFWT